MRHSNSKGIQRLGFVNGSRCVHTTTTPPGTSLTRILYTGNGLMHSFIYLFILRCCCSLQQRRSWKDSMTTTTTTATRQWGKRKVRATRFILFFFLKEGTTVRGACINKLEERSASKSSAPSTLFASHGRVTFVVFCLQNKAQKKKKLKLWNCENRTAAPVF